MNFSLKHSEICEVFNIIEKTIAGPTLCAQLMGRAQLSRPLPPSARPSGPFCDAIDLKSVKATNRRPPAQHNRRARATTWCRAKLATPSEVTFWAVRLAAVVYIYMGRDRSMIILLGLGSPAKAQPDELLG